MPLIALIVGVSILLMNEREYLKEGIKMTREEAIDTLKNGLWWDRRRLDEAIDIAISALRPAADVAEVRHGRWEFLGPNRLIKSCMCGTCSVCHVRSKFISNIAICPTCGAHMDGEIKNETN